MLQKIKSESQVAVYIAVDCLAAIDFHELALVSKFSATMLSFSAFSALSTYALSIYSTSALPMSGLFVLSTSLTSPLFVFRPFVLSAFFCWLYPSCLCIY